MKGVKTIAGSFFVALTLSIAIAGTAWSAKPNPDTLRIALLPDESPETIIEVNKPFKKYLEKTLNKDIELIVTTDYSSMIEAFRHGKLEMAYFGPLSYVMLQSKHDNVEPFAAKMKDGKTSYNSILIVPSDSPVHFIWQLEGKDIGFGDPASTSSHLIPKQMLAKYGELDPAKDFQTRHLGAHDAVAMAVMNKKVQAGGLSLPILKNLTNRGVIDRAKIRQIQISAPIPEYPFVYRKDLKPSLKKSIRQSFFNLEDESILKPLRAEGFAPIDDSAYNIIRETASILNMSLGN
jgi:phosphonate transport system substrate-binding protein